MSNFLSPKLNDMGCCPEKHDISKETREEGDYSNRPISIEETEGTGNNLPKTNKLNGPKWFHCKFFQTLKEKL